jgi:putative transposase
MNGFSFRKNMVFEWHSVSYKIIKLEKNGDVVLQKQPGLEASIASRDKLLLDYSAGNVRVINYSGTDFNKADTPLFARPLDELSEKIQVEIKRRMHYLQKIISGIRPTFTDHYLKPIIKTAAAEINDDYPPSPRTVRRWYAKFIRSKDFRSLIPRIDLRGSTMLKQPAKVMEIITLEMEKAFQLSPQTNVPALYDKIVNRIELENQKVIGGEKIFAPSKSTLYRMLERAEVYEIVRLKEGKAVADRRFKIVKKGVKTTRILERVEIDHTPLDLFLVDEKTWLPLGRPTLSVAIDHFSRMLVGYYLTFDSPSTAALMGVLRHAILPKKLDVSALPELKINHSWPCYGLLEQLVVDNGLEFHSDSFESVCFDLGINIMYCPKRQPRFKGVVERYLQTINYTFASQIPGASYAKFYLRGDYDPQKSAILTLGQFKQIFEKWVVDFYAQKIHRGINTTPWAKWHEGLVENQPILPNDLNTLQRRIGKVVERKLRPDGLLINGIRYNGDELAPILRMYDAGVQVRAVYDPEDLGEIQVWGPDSNDPVPVKALDWEYANGLTERQNEFIQASLREKNTKIQNKGELVQARCELSMAIEELMHSPKQKSRQRSGALRGFTSSKPKGSKLAVETSKPTPNPNPKLKVDDAKYTEMPPLLPTFTLE